MELPPGLVIFVAFSLRVTMYIGQKTLGTGRKNVLMFVEDMRQVRSYITSVRRREERLKRL